MADILINGNKLVRGKLSIVRTADTVDGIANMYIEGKLATHRYIEEITSLKTSRFYLSDITVFQESFGSEDFNIIYSFTAGEFEVLGETDLTLEEIDYIETKMYDDTNKDRGEE